MRASKRFHVRLRKERAEAKKGRVFSDAGGDIVYPNTFSGGEKEKGKRRGEWFTPPVHRKKRERGGKRTVYDISLTVFRSEKRKKEGEGRKTWSCTPFHILASKPGRGEEITGEKLGFYSATCWGKGSFKFARKKEEKKKGGRGKGEERN